MRRLLAATVLSASACGQEGATSPTPGPAPARVDCATAPPARVTPGVTLAFMTEGENTVATFAVDAATGCWTRLDSDAVAGRAGALVVHPSGDFLFASGSRQPRETAVHVFRIDRARGALDPVGSFPLEQGWWEPAGRMAVTADALYVVTRPLTTGYHGGFWRFQVDASGRLSWRGSPHRNFEPFFVESLPSRSTLYLGTHIREPFFRTAAVALAVRGGGDVVPVGEVELGDDYADAVADPAGAFLWVGTGYVDAGVFTRLQAYRPAPNGTLGRPQVAEWGRPLPAPHPLGRVLYVRAGAAVEAHAVDAEGLPVRASSAPGPDGPGQLAVDPSGAYVFAVSEEGVRGYATGAGGLALRDLGRVAGGGRAVALATAR